MRAGTEWALFALGRPVRLVGLDPYAAEQLGDR